MRFLYPLIIFTMAIIVGVSWWRIILQADPKVEGVAFLDDVRKGNLAKTVKHFGGNVCHCPAKGGWGSYLIYASGQEPNLAFMEGHPFTMGVATVTHLKNERLALLPWQKPEDVAFDVPITFDPTEYAPYFLPLPMAYGDQMNIAELNEFLKDPDKDAWKGFTLRFRPNIMPGAVAPPNQEVPLDEFQAMQKKNDTKSGAPLDGKPAPSLGDKLDNPSTEDAVKEALGARAAHYLKPHDAGAVVDEKGNVIPSEQVQKMLPRLKTAIMRLHVVRRGNVNDWTIYHFGLMYPVLVTPDGKEIHLTHDKRPDYLPKDPTQRH